jgi:hypothetical protein
MGKYNLFGEMISMPKPTIGGSTSMPSVKHDVGRIGACQVRPAIART